MAKITATIDLCTWKKNIRGTRMLVTKYNNWQDVEADSKKKIQTYAKGVACGLSFKFAKAAVRVRYADGTEEEIFNED